MNNLGQRTAVSTTGDAFAQSPADWTWTYDALGQITKANTDQYTYDQIGNRLTSGKQNGAQTAYTANALQYTAVHTTEPAYEADGNQLTGLTATAALPDRNTLTFTWNADNRPVEIKQKGEPKELRTYDHMGRRIRKGDTLTLYDGYNAIAEYNLNTHALKTTYAWGNDLSGTLQGAGGVGGLLSVTEHDKQTPLVSYPCYDGNGNITEYLTEENGGTLAAHYQYDAFGNVTKKTGEREYNYQFSTKPYDALTGMNYYNYRDYDPVNGRWINRDPIEERGGMNLYGFIDNKIINNVDAFGMIKYKPVLSGDKKPIEEVSNSSRVLQEASRPIGWIEREKYKVYAQASYIINLSDSGGEINSCAVIVDNGSKTGISSVGDPLIKNLSFSVSCECDDSSGEAKPKIKKPDSDSKVESKGGPAFSTLSAAVGINSNVSSDNKSVTVTMSAAATVMGNITVGANNSFNVSMIGVGAGGGTSSSMPIDYGVQLNRSVDRTWDCEEDK